MSDRARASLDTDGAKVCADVSVHVVYDLAEIIVTRCIGYLCKQHAKERMPRWHAYDTFIRPHQCIALHVLLMATEAGEHARKVSECTHQLGIELTQVAQSMVKRVRPGLGCNDDDVHHTSGVRVEAIKQRRNYALIDLSCIATTS